MNVLVLGSGGREHAFAWKLSQSSITDQLYVAPGNAGTAAIATNLAVNPEDFQAVKRTVLEYNIGLVIVGPEAPLVQGIVDFFRSDEHLSHVQIVGPDAKGALLEGSKDVAKAFMTRYGIPTARYASFTAATLEEGFTFLDQMPGPYVLKADGLAAGKGVLIIQDLDTAKSSLREMLTAGKFGEAGNTVVIEEFLTGIECSVFVLTDGTSYRILPEAKDYKRIGEGDTGPNTGGMGAVSPVPFCDEAFMDKVVTRIVGPTLQGIREERMDYRGFIFIGLMNVGGDPYVIEYNCRMGDPETEAVLPRIASDLGELMLATASCELDRAELVIDSRTAVTVVIVSGGYPDAYEKGKEVTGLDHATGSVIFHAGTFADGTIVRTQGGRVFAVTHLADDLATARESAMATAAQIRFEKSYYRKDIGLDLMNWSA